MARKRKGPRAWARWASREECWEVVAIRVADSPNPGEATTTRQMRSLPRETTEEEAHRIAAILSARLRSGWYERPASWLDATTGYVAYRANTGDRESTLATYRYHFKAVGRVLESPPPLALTLEDANAFRQMRLSMPGARRDRTISPATVRSEMSAVVSLQRWMCDKGWVDYPTWAKAKLPKGKYGTPILFAHELGPFIRAAYKLTDRYPRWPALMWLLLHGLRSSEVLQLRAGDIDHTRGLVYVVDRPDAHTKAESSHRVVPIASELALDALQETFGGLQHDELCLPGRRKQRMKDGKPLLKRIRATVELAGVRHVTAHGLRHTAATMGVGAGLRSVSKLLGHSRQSVTESVYVHSVNEEARPAAMAIGALYDRLGQPKVKLSVVS